MNKNNNKFKADFFLGEEIIFAFVALVFGVLFTFLNPPYQSVKEDYHFYNVFTKSEGKILPEKNGDKIGYMIPRSIVGSVNAINKIDAKKDELVSSKTIDNISKIKLNINDREFIENSDYDINPIAYIPNIIGIMAGKIINTNPIYLLWASRIGGVIIYIIIVFFAIKLIPFYKKVFLLIALSPVAIYQSASVNDNILVLALSLLIISMILRFAVNDEKIRMMDIIILILVTFFHRFSKDGYYLLPFILLLIPKNKFQNSIWFYILLAYFVLLIFLPGLTWGSMMSSAGSYNTFHVHADYAYDSALNLSYLLSNPVDSIAKIFLNIFSQGGNLLPGAFASFGISDLTPPVILVLLHIFIIMTVAIFDNKKDILLSSKIKYFYLVLGIISIFVLLTGFYINDSPIGSNIIYGLEGRFLLPIVPLLLFVFYNNYYRNENIEKYGSLIIGLYSILFLSYISYFLGSNLYA